MKSYVAHDLVQLRWAYPDDTILACALEATAKEVLRARKAPRTFGRPLAHGLAGWRRSAFPSIPHSDADLRLIFRARESDGVDVIAFGKRWMPDTTSIYVIVAGRT